MRMLLMAAVLALLGGCARQQAGHTENMGEVLAKIERDQLFRNISEFHYNKSRVPIPYEIRTGSATLNSGIATGVSPNITFIGPGLIPGLRLEGNIDFQRNFTITPTTSLSSRLRARALFQYAVCDRPPTTSCSYAAFREEFRRLGSALRPGEKSTQFDGLTQAVERLVGQQLPEGPLVGYGHHCNGNPTRYSTFDDPVPYCFLDALDSTSKRQPGTSQHVEALFVQWLTSVTQGIDRAGTITQGTRELFVPSGPEVSIGRNR